MDERRKSVRPALSSPLICRSPTSHWRYTLPDKEGTKNWPCDLCGSDDADEIECARHYTKGEPLHVCRSCGFVYVRNRRSAEAIADSWSNEIFGSAYTAHIPAVGARLTYVAQFTEQTIGLGKKRLLDIGAGEGVFLDMARESKYGSLVFGVEPSATYCDAMRARGIESFAGTIEDYLASDKAGFKGFDIITVMWTLENCQSCRAMLDGAWELLRDGGHIIVSTGSRILVPFKKPLQYYLGPGHQDTHAFRFSANTLRGHLAKSHFDVVETNRFIDNDILCLAAQKVDRSNDLAWQGDNPDAVLDFFARWHTETARYYTDA